MSVFSDEARIAHGYRLSRTGGIDDGFPRRQPLGGRPRARALDWHRQQMRWIGVGLCLVSAMITLASATLIAFRF